MLFDSTSLQFWAWCFGHVLFLFFCAQQLLFRCLRQNCKMWWVMKLSKSIIDLAKQSSRRIFTLGNRAPSEPRCTVASISGSLPISSSATLRILKLSFCDPTPCCSGRWLVQTTSHCDIVSWKRQKSWLALFSNSLSRHGWGRGCSSTYIPRCEYFTLTEQCCDHQLSPPARQVQGFSPSSLSSLHAARLVRQLYPPHRYYRSPIREVCEEHREVVYRRVSGNAILQILPAQISSLIQFNHGESLLPFFWPPQKTFGLLCYMDKRPNVFCACRTTNWWASSFTSAVFDKSANFCSSVNPASSCGVLDLSMNVSICSLGYSFMKNT